MEIGCIVLRGSITSVVYRIRHSPYWTEFFYHGCPHGGFIVLDFDGHAKTMTGEFYRGDGRSLHKLTMLYSRLGPLL